MKVIILANMLVVVAFINDGKYLDEPSDSEPIVNTLNPISIDVTTLNNIHHKIPSKALNPSIPDVIPMKILEQTLHLLIKS